MSKALSGASFAVVPDPPKPAITPEQLEQIGVQVGKIVRRKNIAYGSSFMKAGPFLALLYPKGIKPEQYSDALIMTRIWDKLMRIATMKDAFNENPYLDIAGYGVLGVALHGSVPEVEGAD
jgi:hypothetical protein